MYMAVTADKYEYPICYGDTQRELANKLGINDSTVTVALRSGGKSKKTFNKERYKIVEVDTRECTDCVHCVWKIVDAEWNHDYRCDIDNSVLPPVVCPEFKEKK